VEEIVAKVFSFLKRRGIKVKFLKSASDFGYSQSIVKKRDFLKNTSLLIAIGGDGTILASSHLVEERSIPIMGINVGSLGFLTLFSPKSALPALNDFLEGKAKMEERMALRAFFRKRIFFALNDVCINFGPTLRAIDIFLYSRDKYISHFLGDGVIIATPTGSTAYSLACGGSIIHPSLSCLIITPISPHGLTARPLILSAEEEIIIELSEKSERGVLVIDGQKRLPIQPKERVKVSAAKGKVKLLSPEEFDYFSILRQKMRWGG
jgi:NAD+ kinase